MRSKSLDWSVRLKWIVIWTGLLLPGLLGQPASSFCMCMVARKVPMMLSACLQKLLFRKAPASNQKPATRPPSRPQAANTLKPTTPAAATTMGRKRRLSDQGGRATPPTRYAIDNQQPPPPPSSSHSCRNQQLSQDGTQTPQPAAAATKAPATARGAIINSILYEY